MSWVRNAIQKIEAQDYEILHQTVFGGYGTKTSIFWAIDPIDVPVSLRENVEETVKENTVGQSKCAIIRLEILPGYDDEELQATGNPVACFSVYIGTHGSNVVYDRQINIYGERKPATPKAGRPPSQIWGEIEGNSISKRFRKMSVTMGWTEPPPMVRQESSAFGDGGYPISPIQAPVADRSVSLALPDHQYRTEEASKRGSKRMSLRPGWEESCSPSIYKSHNDTHDEVLEAALAALEGFRPSTFTSSTVAGPSETTLRNIGKMAMTKRTSYYTQDSETNRLHIANVRSYYHDNTFKSGSGLLGTPFNHYEERSLPSAELHLPGMTSRKMKRLSNHRLFQFFQKDITESDDTTIHKLESTPNRKYPVGLKNAPGPLERTSTLLESGVQSAPGSTEPTTRMMKRNSGKRTSRFIEDDIQETGEMPMINFQNLPSQPDPAALKEALAALEGTQSPAQKNIVSERPEITLRRMKRMSAKRVSLFLEDDIPEVGEPESSTVNDAPDVPVKSHHRKVSVECALAALEAPNPTRANMGRPRRLDASARSRKTMSMYSETGPGLTTSHASNNSSEPRSFFDAEPPETEFESKSRKLKKLSWNVIGRALPQPRETDAPLLSNIPEHPSASHSAKSTARRSNTMTWLGTVQATPEPPVRPSFGTASNSSWDQPTLNVRTECRVEPVSRKNNRSSWYSMDPAVAEIQCSPRKEYGPPPPWLEPDVQATRSLEPGNRTSRKLRRTSWFPAAREVLPDPPSPLREASLAVPGVSEESDEDVNLRKKMNGMSKFVFIQGPKKKYTQEVFPQLGGPLNSHPLSCNPSRPETPVRMPHMSRMKKLGLQLGRIFR
ncbi:hypothetical protein N0V82_007053 [Gnomoniopsis sp. IMI 355080]|nr:hypothetical protein N0V82_007053 [Gnomoniopsis sp. IMI 355080]